MAVLVQLIHFVGWPEAALPQAGQPFSICVLAKDRWIPLLQKSSQGESLSGHPLTVIRIAKPQEARGCQILVIGGTPERDWLEMWGSWPVLTIGDEDRPQASGAMVNLTVEGGRTRFRLNPELARRANLRFSSKLLRLGGVAARGEP
ncbi:MAG: YfiR family protein [Bryobacteraceae bacterium]